MTKTGMPARAASSMVADTVVAPSSRPAMTAGRSRREVFCTYVSCRLAPVSAGLPVATKFLVEVLHAC